jgi:hypothetical protein
MSEQFEQDLKAACEEIVSEEADQSDSPLAIYDCEDCGARFAAKILSGPKQADHAYLAAGGGKPFVACCPVCGGTMIADIGPRL